jgi:hypothetical protein
MVAENATTAQATSNNGRITGSFFAMAINEHNRAVQE